ncbi:MAG TPA: Crp/Fnr family transcriptional regulator [Candidatus Acidoferrum sp.]|nr:Crp/Fnr family transcriptional regulator [Candidatus Acidoferrum sp.]
MKESAAAALALPDEVRDLSANRVLRSLSKEAQAELWPHFERVAMDQGHVYNSANARIEHLYFVERGLVSLVKVMKDGRTIEIGAVGIEGVADPCGIFDAERAILESVVQIPGTALRIERNVLARKIAHNGAILHALRRYTAVALNQFMQTAACNCLHSIDQRACRWLLIAHDSALADTFPLTQEFLAMMLGVQRASVSIAAQTLHRAGLIEYTRGRVTIVDRAGLERAACECYGTLREQLNDLYLSHQDRHPVDIARARTGRNVGYRADEPSSTG